MLLSIRTHGNIWASVEGISKIRIVKHVGDDSVWVMIPDMV